MESSTVQYTILASFPTASSRPATPPAHKSGMWACNHMQVRQSCTELCRNRQNGYRYLRPVLDPVAWQPATRALLGTVLARESSGQVCCVPLVPLSTAELCHSVDRTPAGRIRQARCVLAASCRSVTRTGRQRAGGGLPRRRTTRILYSAEALAASSAPVSVKVLCPAPWAFPLAC